MRARPVTFLALAAVILALLPGPVAGAAVPSLSIGDLVVTEPSGKSGSARVAVPLVLDVQASGPVVVAYRTEAGTAGTSDFVSATSSLTIQSGTQGGGLPLDIRADRTAEGTETFSVEITGVTGATLGDPLARIDIRDASSGLAVADVTILEPDATGVDVPIAVTVPSAPAKPVTFDWQVRSGTATTGSDVAAASGSGVIPKGALSAIVWARVHGDTTVEGSEAFDVVVTAVRNVALADGLGRVTLVDDDVPPPTPSPTPTPTPTPAPTPTPTPTATPSPTPVPTDAPTPTPTPTDPLGGWGPPAGSIPPTGTVVYLESAPGDFVGQGGTHSYTLATALVAFDPAGDRFSVHVRGDETWDGWFAPQAPGTPLTTGAWAGLTRYPFAIPGLSWSGEGRGCNTLVGSLVIDALDGSTTDPGRLVARFEQRCDNSTGVLRGYLRYERDDPTTPPHPGDPAGYPWSPPAGVIPASGDAFYFESTAGDWIGQGRTDLFTPATSSFTTTESSGVVTVRVQRGEDVWTVRLSGPDAQAQLVAGWYDGLGRHPFHNPVEGGLSVSGEGRGCNELAGSFAVDHVVYDAQGLAGIEVRLTQHCEETGPPLRAVVRWTRPAA